jgi:hypothetical protein
VKSAVGRLKPHKNDGGSCLSTDNFINAGDDCFTHIALLLTSITVHGTAPNSFHVSTIVPIPKGRNNNLADSSNFRGIALSPIYGKIYDNIVLSQHIDTLMSSELQFGFKAHRSTNMCTMILKETMAYYSSNNSSVFCTFLDSTKAFDRVNYCKLFKLLIKRQLPAHVIRLLINMYSNNFVRIAWGGVLSDYFLAVNGVKQGGVLSPVLYCVYIDDLLLALSNSGVGCYIGSNFVGALVYADDIVLIAPTATAMRKLLSICGEFATEYCISFNASKSKCLAVLPAKYRELNSYLNECRLTVNDQPIELVQSFQHLGHTITSQLNDVSDITAKQYAFIGQTNNVLCFFRKLTSYIKYRLFRSYCTSYYGCELWSLTTSNISDFCTAWRRGVRSIWNLPYTTHCYLLPLICQCLPVFDELCRRSINFARSCVSHESKLISQIASYCIHFARCKSPMGSNILFCADRYQTNIDGILSGSSNYIVYSHYDRSIVDVQLRASSFLSELVSIRDSRQSFIGSGAFTKAELADIINHICTS